MADPQLSTVLQDPKFTGLPPEEQNKVVSTLLDRDPKFTALPKEEQQKVRDHFNRATGQPQDRPAGKPTEPTKITKTSLDIFNEWGDKTILPMMQRFVRTVSAEYDAINGPNGLNAKDPVTGKSEVDYERERRGRAFRPFAAVATALGYA